MQNDTLLRPLWLRVFGRAWILSLVLFVIMGALRAYGLLGPPSANALLALNFLLMWFIPVTFLTKSGRRAIGLRRTGRSGWLAWALLLGIASSLVVFLTGFLLYGHGPDNWFVTVLNSYTIDPKMEEMPRSILFVMFTLPAILLSPIGEELFFRGMLRESVRQPWGSKAATLVNALAFGGIHILHHGLALSPNGLQLLVVSGLIWVVLMMGLSWILTQCRQRSGSIWPAVVGHASFNLTMNVMIFWVLM